MRSIWIGSGATNTFESEDKDQIIQYLLQNPECYINTGIFYPSWEDNCVPNILKEYPKLKLVNKVGSSQLISWALGQNCNYGLVQQQGFIAHLMYSLTILKTHNFKQLLADKNRFEQCINNVLKHKIQFTKTREEGGSPAEVLLLHSPAGQPDSVPFDDADLFCWSILIELKKRGFVREIGVSNYGPHELKTIMTTGVVPAYNQIEYNLLHQRVWTVEYCKQHNIKVCAYLLFRWDNIDHFTTGFKNKMKESNVTIADLNLALCERDEVTPIAAFKNLNQLKQLNEKVVDQEFLTKEFGFMWHYQLNRDISCYTSVPHLYGIDSLESLPISYMGNFWNWSLRDLQSYREINSDSRFGSHFLDRLYQHFVVSNKTD